MDARLQVVAVIAAAALLLLVLELVRRRRLMERYALLWLLSGVILLALSIVQGALGLVANALGIVEGPNALFVVAFGFVLMVLLHFSTVISSLTDQNKVLAQRLAQLEERVRHHEAASPKPLSSDPTADQRREVVTVGGQSRRR